MINEIEKDLIYAAIKKDIAENGNASISRISESLISNGIDVHVTVIKQRIDCINGIQNGGTDKKNNKGS
jgi:hypothetical protein